MRFRRTVSEGTGDPAPEDRAAELEADVREGGPRRRCGTAIADFKHCSSLLQSPTEGGLQTMANLSSIMKQLKQERDRVKRELSGLEAALTAFASAYSGTKPSRKRRTMSAKSRAKIAAAQKRRWAKVRAGRK
jgi:hypothetical protein